MLEHWVGHRMLMEKMVPPRRAGRSISVLLPVGFLPRSLGVHTSRLRHLGWARCGYDVTSQEVLVGIP